MTDQQQSKNQRFLEAVEEGRHDEVRALIASNVNLEHIGLEPVHDPALVKKSKPSPSGAVTIQDGNLATTAFRIHKKTALYCAVANADVEMVKILLEAGANPDTPISSGLHPFTIAVESVKRKEIVPLFLDHKANPNVTSPYGGGTALASAVRIGTEFNYVARMIELGGDPSLKDNQGRDALEQSKERSITLKTFKGLGPASLLFYTLVLLRHPSEIVNSIKISRNDAKTRRLLQRTMKNNQPK